MNPSFRSIFSPSPRPFAAAFVIAALISSSVDAGVTGVTDSNANEGTFSPTSGDLLQTSVASASHTGWSTNNGANTVSLTDGVYGSVYVSGTVVVDGAWDRGGTPVSTYTLDISSNTLGYDLTSIVSIAGWSSAGLGNQNVQIEVSTVGSAGFTPLATGAFSGFGATLSGTSIITFKDDTVPGAVIASGVDAIRFTSLDAGGTNNWAIFREFDVVGTATVGGPDLDPPTLDTLSSVAPADDTTGVAVASNLEATFNEPVALTGAGSISLKNLSGGADIPITLPDARVSVSGAVLTINPDTDLAAATHYAVQIGAAVIDDLSGNSYAGIADETTWDFTTGTPDVTAPTLATLSPTDNATNVPLASNLIATFSENIALGSGSITLKNLDTLSDTVITLPDARVSVSGSVLTINPSSNLAASTAYAIQIDATAITDIAGNPFGGIGADPTWNFATATTPLRIVCMGDSITTGYTDNPGWVNHPFEFGYRSGLYTLLTNAGYNFLFVGGSTEPWTGISGDPTQGGTYTPPLDLRDFGQDGHRGYGGKTASYLNSNILSWLATDNPDIILLKIGTNSQDQSGLETLVNTITTTKPDCHLIIAQIMPKYSYQQGIVNYNTYIRDTLVPAQQALVRNVTLVDQYAPLLTNPADLTSIDQSLFSNGINHPDNDGYDKMAQVWFDGIETLGIGPNSFATWISDPAFGIAAGQQGLDKDPDGDGIANGIENILGTNPGAFSQGLSAVPVNAAAGTFIFTHSLNPTPAPKLTATYRWSKNLTNFTDDGNAFEDTTVTFSRSAPTGGVVTVTASVAGTPLDRLFVDIMVQQN